MLIFYLQICPTIASLVKKWSEWQWKTKNKYFIVSRKQNQKFFVCMALSSINDNLKQVLSMPGLVQRGGWGG